MSASSRPAIIGHRGARALFAENTIEGFRAAIARGVAAFEVDAGLTADGVVVLHHDARLSRDLTRDCSGRWLGAPGPWLHRCSHEELLRFDVGRARPGSRTARRFPRQQAFDGARIATLRDALALDPAVRWTIEIKTFANRPWATARPEAIVEAVAHIVDQAGVRAVVQSFDWRGPRHLRRQRPDLDYAWLTTRSTRAWRGGQHSLPESVAAEGGHTWSPRYPELTPRLLERAKRCGLRVVPWTVNQPALLHRFAAWGVDGIITDDPVMARAVLRPGALAPPPGPAPS